MTSSMGQTMTCRRTAVDANTCSALDQNCTAVTGVTRGRPTESLGRVPEHRPGGLEIQRSEIHEFSLSDLASSADRFWSRVAKGDGCWEWTGSLRGRRYGWVKFEGRAWLVHRLAWTLTNGPIPTGLLVCHRCDNPKCCNPGHLFLGTHRDNMRDMTEKGRRLGLKNAAKLTAADVAQLRSEAERGVTNRDLACRYGVSVACVSYIVRRITWRDIA